MEKEYQYWMDGAEALEPGSASKRVVRMADGALLNRYWDDNDTPRPESWLDDVTTAKNNPNRRPPKSTAIALRRGIRLGLQLPLDG
jgi:alpha,alpha-trehalase